MTQSNAPIENKVKLCKDCKYFDDYMYGLCIRTIKSHQNVLTGFVTESIIRCNVEREGFHHWRCGKEGKFFEQKEDIKKESFLKSFWKHLLRCFGTAN
jgi:hypothetical protein